MKNIIYIFLLISTVSFGQYSPLQSQYMFNGIALNPALTGSEQTLSIVGSFRSQWTGFRGAPKTEVLTAHAPLKNKSSAFGVQIYGDQIGVSRNLGIYGMYAYNFKIGNASNLSLGISGGINMVREFYDKLDLASQNDLLLSGTSPLGVLPNFSLGAHYATSKYFVSFSIPMFLSHNFDGAKFRVQNDFNNYNFLLGGGYDFELKNKMHLKPSVLLKYRANNRLQADINLKLRINEIIDVGATYRTEEAMVLFFEGRINQQFSAMYSFGLPLSSLIKYSYGSHEISVKYNFMYKTKSASPRYLGW